AMLFTLFPDTPLFAALVRQNKITGIKRIGLILLFLFIGYPVPIAIGLLPVRRRGAVLVRQNKITGIKGIGLILLFLFIDYPVAFAIGLLPVCRRLTVLVGQI